MSTFKLFITFIRITENVHTFHTILINFTFIFLNLVQTKLRQFIYNFLNWYSFLRSLVNLLNKSSIHYTWILSPYQLQIYFAKVVKTFVRGYALVNKIYS